MDNAMVKRGIGAVALAVIAALLLGYLLNGKSNERKKVTEIALPNAPEMSIPSLTDAVSNIGDSAATLVDETKDTVVNAGDTVVAAVTNTASTATEAVKSTVENVATTKKPGFSIRPSQNESKEIVDNTNNNNATTPNTALNNEENTQSNADVVVASTTPVEKKVEKVFKPVIVKPKPKKAKKKVVKKPVVKKPAKTSASMAKSPADAAASGKYSIQLLATSSESRAKKLANVMNGEGYQSFITHTTNNNKLLYRVRIGAHADRSAAVKAQEGMKRRYRKNFFVQNSLVISN